MIDLPLNTDLDHRLMTARAAQRGKLTTVKGTNSTINMRRSAETRDNMMTFDRATVDSSGAFLVGELERLDQRLHMPLASVTWQRDIDLRTDVSMADEDSSFTNSFFSSAQGIAGSNKAWAGKDSSALVGVGLDTSKTLNPLTIWAAQLSWTLPELISAEKLGRPVDQQKYEGMQLKYQMDIDEQVYVGDTGLGVKGMLNSATITNTGNNASGVTWLNATPAQILGDINSLLDSVYTTAGFAVIPPRLLVDPISYGVLVSTLISTAGNISVMEFVKKNSLSNAANGKELEIQPCKWLLGTSSTPANSLGIASSCSMIAYVRDPVRIRFPLVPLQRTPMEYRDIRQLVTYFGRLGVVEVVYPEVVGIRSGID